MPRGSRGTVPYLPAVTPEAVEKFWRRVVKGDADACWLVRTKIERDKYPGILIDGRQYLMHRLSWVIHNRTEPGPLLVCHSCDVAHCVNPAHLWLGTDRDNTVDSYAKRALAKERDGV